MGAQSRQRGVRHRGSVIRATVGVVAIALIFGIVVAGPAQAAETATVRTLLLSERFFAGGVFEAVSQPSAQGNYTLNGISATPHNLLALRNDTEGFQLAFDPSATGCYEARVKSTSAPLLRTNTRIYRIGFVPLTQRSTGYSGALRDYPDPLPPQVPTAGDPGRLCIGSPTMWGGFVVLVDVPTNATVDTPHTGAIEIVKGNTVIATQSYQLTVRQARNSGGTAINLPHPGSSAHPRAMIGFDPFTYRDTLREEIGGAADLPDARLAASLNAFFSRHRVVPTQTLLEHPRETSGTFAYGSVCAGSEPTQIDPHNSGTQLVGDYRTAWPLSGVASRWSAHMFPNQSPSYCGDGRTLLSVENSRTPCAADRSNFPNCEKYDDSLNPVAPTFLSGASSFWQSNGLFTGCCGTSPWNATYFLNPFDEPPRNSNTLRGPSGQTSLLLRSNGPIATLNQLVHGRVPGAKVILTQYPDTASAVEDWMWKSTGGDRRVDVFAVPDFRQWGGTQVGGTRAMRTLLNQLRAQPAAAAGAGNIEVWSYNFFRPTTRMPQLVIDAPSTDTRLALWHNAYLGNTGWYTATSDRWEDPIIVNPDPAGRPWAQRATTCFTTAQINSFGVNYDNPWVNPLTWTNAVTSGVSSPECANGWGSLYYPGYRPAVGLTDPGAEPVSSLRLEGIQQGVEDASLFGIYRQRFPSRVESLFARVLTPGSTTVPPTSSTVADPAFGTVSYPSYTNTGMALRMEVERRRMITEMAA